MENETTFTVEEVQEALHDAIVEKLENEGYNFNDTDISNENSFNQELDKIADSIIENASDNGLTEVANDEFKLDKDLSEWANEQAAQEFANGSLDKAIEEGYLDKYEISESVKDLDNWTDSIKEMEDRSYQDQQDNTISNDQEVDRQASFEFSETLAIESGLDNDTNDSVMTREEGIEKALEAGVDINDLAELTSKEEVLEAARNSSDFEVINAYDLQNEATEKVAELLIEEAKEFGLEINADNLNAVVADVINQDYVSGDSSIADTINNLDTDNNATVLDNSSTEVILNTENMSREELVEAIAASLYEDNKEALQEKVNNGETFELSQFDKSEVNFSDTMESFNSKAENAELSKDNEGQKSTDSVKQK